VRQLPRTPGTYALVLELPRPVEIEVGRLGKVFFNAPFYIYVGSALGSGGLAARLRHHLRRAARPHWHIDYLRRCTEIREIWLSEGDRHFECSWSKKLAGTPAAQPVTGFGSSDCRCESHLVALTDAPDEAWLRDRCLVRSISQPLVRICPAQTLAVQTLSHDAGSDHE
jgi:Uri superfamily endonuclease